jgi:hypothetical protein
MGDTSEGMDTKNRGNSPKYLTAVEGQLSSQKAAGAEKSLWSAGSRPARANNLWMQVRVPFFTGNNHDDCKKRGGEKDGPRMGIEQRKRARRIYHLSVWPFPLLTSAALRGARPGGWLFSSGNRDGSSG